MVMSLLTNFMVFEFFVMNVFKWICQTRLTFSVKIQHHMQRPYNTSTPFFFPEQAFKEALQTAAVVSGYELQEYINPFFARFLLASVFISRTLKPLLCNLCLHSLSLSLYLLCLFFSSPFKDWHLHSSLKIHSFLSRYS